MPASSIQRLTLYRLAIRLRGQVSHAAAERHVAEPLVVKVELRDGVTGYGETLPREYVSGETVETVVADLRSELIPLLLDWHPESFPHALEAIDALPVLASRTAHGPQVARGDSSTPADESVAGVTDSPGRVGNLCPTMTAARAALELALLDAYSRHFRKPLSEAAGWLGMVGLGPPGSLPTVRYSGVLAGKTIRDCLRQLRPMRWFGLRHFKLKVGFADDDQRVRSVLGGLQRSIDRGQGSLRLDVNGAWGVEEAIECLGRWADLPIASVEQPLGKGHESDLAQLARSTRFPIVLDESLVTEEDGRHLIELGAAGGFNVRLSKCGGLLPSLKLAGLARKHGITVQLGCMVGETGILSAAGLRFLELVPGVVHAEGCFGRFLLAADVCRPSPRFRYGGRPPKLPPTGLGIEVLDSPLNEWSAVPPEIMEL